MILPSHGQILDSMFINGVVYREVFAHMLGMLVMPSQLSSRRHWHSFKFTQNIILPLVTA